MAVCLDYQSVYCKREELKISLRLKILAGALIISALAFKVWVKIESTDVGYQLAKERSRAVELDMKRRELELELSILTRPDSLATRAHAELGLVTLDPNQARKIRE